MIRIRIRIFYWYLNKCKHFFFSLIALILWDWDLGVSSHGRKCNKIVCLYFYLREVISHLYTSRYIAHRHLTSDGLRQCEEANLHLVLWQQTSLLSIHHRSRSLAQQFYFAADGTRSWGYLHASLIRQPLGWPG